MREKITKLFLFAELSDHAKEYALGHNRDWNLQDEWWESVYDDAERSGLRVTSFDLDRRRDIGIQFTESAESCARRIRDEHGANCDTKKEADSYLASRGELISNWPKTEDGEFEDFYELDARLDDLDKDFLYAIGQCYLTILQKEYEYLSSDESLIESFEANETEFTEDGRLA